MKNLFLFLFLLVVFTSKAQDNRVSGLNSRQFTKYWKVESESPDYKVTFQGDTAEIVSPKDDTTQRLSENICDDFVDYITAGDRILWNPDEAKTAWFPVPASV